MPSLLSPPFYTALISSACSICFSVFRSGGMLILGFVYSVSISWNINGVSHNFIHNPYFPFAAAESVVQHHGIDHGRL
jgi:hypothetical protein